jgi:hypothetical protein
LGPQAGWGSRKSLAMGAWAMFIQAIVARVSDRSRLRAELDRWVAEVEPGAVGFLGSTSGFANDGTFVVVARFSSQRSARESGQRPEYAAWWSDVARCFDGDPELMNCSETFTWLNGGSDDARFVQVITGRALELDRVRALLERYGDRIREHRPEIIGGTAGVDSSGNYVQTVYFTSEVEACTGERREPPADLATPLAELAEVMTDLRYLDLREPMLISAD